MSRHKFRAWDKVTQKMFAVGFHLIGEVMAFGVIEGYVAENPAGKTILERMGDVEVMQWTGLQDKKGKDIYEGDIVRLADKYSYVVKFEDARYVCDHVVERWGRWGNLHRFKDHDFEHIDFRVIGNIFENPELLKV